jgi:ABC-2 type transport system ATP-binding protein
VLLTTHYMDEAERLCQRLAIMDQGAIIAQGEPRELIARLGGSHCIELTVAPDRADAAEGWRRLPGICSVRGEAGRYEIVANQPETVLPQLLTALQPAGQTAIEIGLRQASLEDVFVQLTGRKIE